MPGFRCSDDVRESEAILRNPYVVSAGGLPQLVGALDATLPHFSNVVARLNKPASRIRDRSPTADQTGTHLV
jgi:hypothetical protein